jgi:hypothetical protein
MSKLTIVKIPRRQDRAAKDLSLTNGGSAYERLANEHIHIDKLEIKALGKVSSIDCTWPSAAGNLFVLVYCIRPC